MELVEFTLPSRPQVEFCQKLQLSNPKAPRRDPALRLSTSSRYLCSPRALSPIRGGLLRLPSTLSRSC